MQRWTIDAAGYQGSYWTWPSHELGQRSWGRNNVKCKMHQIVIDKWNLQITRVNEIIASRPVGQAMPAIGCYQFLPSSSSPCLAVKTTHDNWYNDIRQLFNCEKRFFIETKLQKGLRINPVVGAGHIAMISTATKLRYFLEDTYPLIGGGLEINRSNLFHKDQSTISASSAFLWWTAAKMSLLACSSE